MTQSNSQTQSERSAETIALIDYGIGNLRSVEKALAAVGARVVLTSSTQDILAAQKIVLPGVGAFGDGIAGLRQRGQIPVLLQAVRRGTPLLGICLGMQLLFESSEEAPQVNGLGILPGQVRRFTDPGLKNPQTGWNQIKPLHNTPLLKGLPPGSYAYFNHGYYCYPSLESDWLASTAYGVDFASVAGRGNLFGVQFHPEKSQQVGLQILKNFVELPA